MFILELIKYGTCNIYYNQRTTIQKIGRMITSQHEKYSSVEKYAVYEWTVYRHRTIKIK